MRGITAVFGVTALTLGLVGGVQAQTTNERLQITVFAFVPCANGGAGELVEVSGTLHVRNHVSMDATGGLHLSSLFNPSGMSGEGVDTGNDYNGVGNTHAGPYNVAAGGFPATFTDVNNFRFVGKGQAEDFHVRQTFHLTVNANGDVTTVVDHTRITCG